MTQRCVEHIKTQCMSDTFARFSELIGCDEKAIRNIADDDVAELDESFHPYLPN
ncbi:hypothetical protein [Pseudomonas aeruginosa]|uniref:hypothetical protein n=1 Tax=Pseudomonas aeruginosa TaxID=287 RepID=UPI001374BFC4|nr:hypothetical protein [Pseudomonas aeruginosa]